MLIGRAKSAMEDYGVTKEEILALIDVIERSPIHLPSLDSSDKKERLALFKGVVETLL